MPKQPASYNKGQIDGFLAHVRQIPPEEAEKRYSTQEAVKVMAKEIRAFLKKGHSIERIGKALREAGFPITDSTLRNYLKSGNPRKKKSTNAIEATPKAAPQAAEPKSETKKPEPTPEPTKTASPKPASPPPAPATKPATPKAAGEKS
jgi:hypothetical protein